MLHIGTTSLPFQAKQLRHRYNNAVNTSRIEVNQPAQHREVVFLGASSKPRSGLWTALTAAFFTIYPFGGAVFADSKAAQNGRTQETVAMNSQVSRTPAEEAYLAVERKILPGLPNMALAEYARMVKIKEDLREHGGESGIEAAKKLSELLAGIESTRMELKYQNVTPAFIADPVNTPTKPQVNALQEYFFAHIKAVIYLTRDLESSLKVMIPPDYQSLGSWLHNNEPAKQAISELKEAHAKSGYDGYWLMSKLQKRVIWHYIFG